MIRASNTQALLQRASFTRVFALAFVVIAVVNVHCIFDPPYWDALMGAFAQGHWLATHSFSPIALLRDGGAFMAGGACVYPYSAYPWIVGGFEALGIAPTSTFAVLHIVSFVSAAAIVAALFRLVRDEVGPGLAAAVAAALLVQPMFRSLASQMNMDVVLTACTVLSIGALSRERYGAASAWSTAAFFVKPTAIILVVGNLAALALRCKRPDWFGLDVAESAARRRRRLVSVCVHAILFACFLVEQAVSAHFGKGAEGVAFFGGLVPFVSKRLWTLPEFAVALVLFVVTLPSIVRRTVRGRASATEIDLALFLIAFTGFFCQYGNILPRYFLQAWPLILSALLMAWLRVGISRRWIVALLVVFGAVGLVNWHGGLYPRRMAAWNDPRTGARLVANDGWLLERSMEYRDDLQLGQDLAARVQSHPGFVVVAGWPLLQALCAPEFGYVLAPPKLAATGPPITFASRPVVRAQDIEPGTPTVRVLSPNVFDGPSSRVLPGDEILDVVERGRLRAFLVKRASGAGGR